MNLLEKLKKSAADIKDTVSVRKIRVLMCGGRRTGKTSIMAALQKNMEEMFPQGNIMLDMEAPNSLILYRRDQENLFGNANADKSSFFAMQNPSSSETNYLCKMILNGKKSGISLEFTDIPGEWFIRPEFEERTQSLIGDSDILLIAVDSPHLMQREGRYHEVFNRAEIITEEIQRAFQGNKVPRMILFVPLKCEKYQNKKRMEELLEEIQKGYRNLLDYLMSPEMKGKCTIAVAPCITLGGCEFLRFVQPVDEEGMEETDSEGNLPEDIGIDPESGKLTMQWMAEYIYLIDEDGEHFYKPQNCEQPLIYLLLYLNALERARKGGLLDGLVTFFRRLPELEDLELCKNDLLQKVNCRRNEGYAVLNDPLHILSDQVREN